MQALVCNSLAPACFSSSLGSRVGKSLRYVILNGRAARYGKKLLTHIKEKTVSLKRGSKKWVEEAVSRSLPQAID